MNTKRFWISLSLINLCIVAFLGFLLRSKILFPLHFINYEHLIEAHYHFAFAGWITLAFLTLFTYLLLPVSGQNRKWYQWMLWFIELTSAGMLISFLVQGYGAASIFFSILFILGTYGYGWCFIKDMLAGNRKQPALALSVCAIASLALSSAGPFTIFYIMASGSGNSILYRDALYLYLHFTYNGFFTLSVFALFFGVLYINNENHVPTEVRRFSYLLCASVIPSFFLSLLWHPHNTTFKVLALLGILFILASLVYFFRLGKLLPLSRVYQTPLARSLWLLALLSFVIKSILQMGTIFPELGTAVFGLRPIIIGFLHLAFLGLATFYLLSNYIQSGIFTMQSGFARWSIVLFIIGVIMQEVILMVQGIGLLMGSAHVVYNWLLWMTSILLFIGALLMASAGLKTFITEGRKAGKKGYMPG